MEENNRTDVLRALHVKYPHVSVLTLVRYLEVYDVIDDDLRVELERIFSEENEELAKQEEEFQERVLVEIERITASMTHRKLMSLLPDVPPDIDVEHLAAVGVYGFATPSQTRKYFGTRKVSEQALYDRVHNKLRVKFKPKSFKIALNYFMRVGVVINKDGYSLNSDKKRMREEGIAIFDAIERFLQEFHNGG